MESSLCSSCHRPKANLECGNCQRPVCKPCSQIVEAPTFSFLESIPAELSHRIYCGACYDEKVFPALSEYENTMEKAKGVLVFLKNQGEETRNFKRSAKPVKVADCLDREEALLRLAFFAAKANFNALVSVSLTYKKVRNAGYQTMHWNGFGIPTLVDEAELNRVR